MRISDWSSDVCSSDLTVAFSDGAPAAKLYEADPNALAKYPSRSEADSALAMKFLFWTGKDCSRTERLMRRSELVRPKWGEGSYLRTTIAKANAEAQRVYNMPSAPDLSARAGLQLLTVRSEEHTSELQSLMRISYAVFCLKKKHHIL